MSEDQLTPEAKQAVEMIQSSVDHFKAAHEGRAPAGVWISRGMRDLFQTTEQKMSMLGYTCEIDDGLPGVDCYCCP
jgi:hypothetical protein